MPHSEHIEPTIEAEPGTSEAGVDSVTVSETKNGTDHDIGATPSIHVRKSRTLKPELRRNLSQCSLDSFLVRDSSLKRKPIDSGDIVSPTTSHVVKATRSDAGDSLS